MSAVDIFGGDSAFVTYEAGLQVRDLLVGGVPRDPGTIRNWLVARLGAGDARLQEIFTQTITDLQLADAPLDEQVTALMKSPAAPSVNGFKRLPTGELAYESRALKAAIKEWANSAYPGTDWEGKYRTVRAEGGKSRQVLAPGCAARKGLMSTIAERVFVQGSLLPLGTKDAEVEERIKHVMTPLGPRSAIGRVEVVERPLVTASIRVRDDFLTQQAWSRIWQAGEEIGIGADRGRSDGRFDLVRWERVP